MMEGVKDEGERDEGLNKRSVLTNTFFSVYLTTWAGLTASVE
jgi:hypothetical protein